MIQAIDYIYRKGFATEEHEKGIIINGHLFGCTQNWINERRREGNLEEILNITCNEIYMLGEKKKEADDLGDIYEEFGAYKGV